MIGRHRPWGLPTLLARAAAWPCHLAGLGVQPRSMSAVRATRAPSLGRGNAAPPPVGAPHRPSSRRRVAVPLGGAQGEPQVDVRRAPHAHPVAWAR